MINPSTLPKDVLKFRNIYRTIALTLLAAILGACHPDRSAILPPDTSALPAVVCPGDTATLSWDGTRTCEDGSCSDFTVNISSSPSGFSSNSTSQTGSVSSPPITSPIDFIFEGTVEGITWGPDSHSVAPLASPSGAGLPDMIGQCDGWLPNTVSLAVGDIRPPGTLVTRIANFTSCRITTDLITTDTLRHRFILEPVMYTDVPPEFQADVQAIEAISVSGDCLRGRPVPSCDTISSGRWPDLILTAEVVCEASSASMPIVVGTPEGDDTPEEAFIVTNTPSATPKITTNRTANCRQGPNDVFDVVTVLNEGFQAEPNGRDWQSTWWRILTPDGLNFCWVSNTVVEFEGPEEDVAVVDSPPTPAVGCLIYDESTPNDLTDTTCVPRACTDKDQPGANCTP